MIIYRGFYQILNILRLTGARILNGEEIIYKYEKEKNRMGPMIFYIHMSVCFMCVCVYIYTYVYIMYKIPISYIFIR